MGRSGICACRFAVSAPAIGLVALIGRQDDPPLSPWASGDGLDLGPPKGRAAVHDGDADLDFGGLAIGIS